MELTDDNFKAEVLDASTPVVVDFWAEWCGPCRAIGPIVEELAGEVVGKVKVGKLDIDKSRNTAMEYGISSIPTILFFNNGEIAKKIVGMTSLEDLRAALNEIS